MKRVSISDLPLQEVDGSQAEEDKVRVWWLLQEVQAPLIALLGITERPPQVVTVTIQSPRIRILLTGWTTLVRSGFSRDASLIRLIGAHFATAMWSRHINIHKLNQTKLIIIKINWFPTSTEEKDSKRVFYSSTYHYQWRVRAWLHQQAFQKDTVTQIMFAASVNGFITPYWTLLLTGL